MINTDFKALKMATRVQQKIRTKKDRWKAENPPVTDAEYISQENDVDIEAGLPM
jgi:hypothetical protein